MPTRIGIGVSPTLSDGGITTASGASVEPQTPPVDPGSGTRDGLPDGRYISYGDKNILYRKGSDDQIINYREVA